MKDYHVEDQVVPRTTIRMTKEQFQKVNFLAKEMKKTVPKVFLDLLDRRTPQVTLLNSDNAGKIKTELNRIGNNINQIARKVNSGEAVLGSSFDEFKEQLNVLYNYMVRTSGLR